MLRLLVVEKAEGITHQPFASCEAHFHCETSSILGTQDCSFFRASTLSACYRRNSSRQLHQLHWLNRLVPSLLGMPLFLPLHISGYSDKAGGLVRDLEIRRQIPPSVSRNKIPSMLLIGL